MADAGGIRAGRAFVELGLSNSKFLNDLAASLVRLKKFGGELKRIGEDVSGAGLKIAALGGAITAPFVESVRHFTQAGDELDKMSKKTGVSVEALSQMKHAAELSGVSMEDLGNGLKFMQKTLGQAQNGSKEATEALAALGLTVKGLQALAPDAQFQLIGQRLMAIKDPAQRATQAMAILGRSGTGLIPLLGDLGALRMEAVKLGLTMSTADAQAAAHLKDQFETLWEVVGRLKDAIGSALTPTMEDWTAKALSVVQAGIRWVQQNQELVITLAKTGLVITGVGIGIVVLGKAMTLLGGVVTTGVKLWTGFTNLLVALPALIGFLLSPVGLITAAIVALAVAILSLTSAGDGMRAWLEDVKKAGSAITDFKLDIDTSALDKLAAEQKRIQEEALAAQKAVESGTLGKAPEGPAGELGGPGMGFLKPLALGLAEGRRVDPRDTTGGVEEAFTLPRTLTLKRQMKAAWEVMGTFNTAAVGRQGIGSTASVQDEMLKAEQEQAELQKAANKQLSAMQKELVRQGKLVVRFAQ